MSYFQSIFYWKMLMEIRLEEDPIEASDEEDV